MILAVTVTVACLKTAVGLITSCSETFVGIFPGGPSYKMWAAAFCALSFLIANLGLNAIIAYSLPVLMFLYPLAIVLILLTLGSRLFGGDRTVLRWTVGLTAVAAAVDFLRALPENARYALHLNGLTELAERFVPFAAEGFGWMIPALVGFGAGLLIGKLKKADR